MKTSHLKTIGERIKLQRQIARLSQENLGIAVGIEAGAARTRISRYETGQREANVDVVADIAKVLNVPLAYFYAQDATEARMLLVFHLLSKVEQEKIWQLALRKTL